MENKKLDPSALFQNMPGIRNRAKIVIGHFLRSPGLHQRQHFSRHPHTQTRRRSLYGQAKAPPLPKSGNAR